MLDTLAVPFALGLAVALGALVLRARLHGRTALVAIEVPGPPPPETELPNVDVGDGFAG